MLWDKGLMTGQQFKIVTVLLLLLIMVGCRQAVSEDELNGRVTLWHSWSPAEATVLEEALAQFQEIHPDVLIITLSLPEDQILEEFLDAGHSGLGPGLLIGDDSWIGELVGTGLIRSISPDGIPSEIFNLRNRALTRYDEQLYGVPLSLKPSALYYNKSLVSDPPTSLDDLLAQADSGNQVAFVPRFSEAYWGIQAFGNGLFDTKARFTLAESGFTEWLTWLEMAQRAPGVILNVDDESLLRLFTTGEIAYYVAGPEKQALITAMIDEEASFDYGVVPLPSGPEGAAGPLLPAETILLYTFASDKQSRIADSLADFLTNQQQSIRFMRELDRVPANPTVRVDRRIYPNVNGFAQQARTAVVIPNEIPTESLVAAGNRAYISVLSGILTPEEAVCRFGQEVAAIEGHTFTEIDLPEGCKLETN